MILKEDIEALRNLDELGDRLTKAAELTSGNIVEIGGGEGINTIRFLMVARERKSAVIVIDPFIQIPGADPSYFGPYSLEQFMENIYSKSEYLAERLLIIKLPSQSTDLYEYTEDIYPVGFMFIDGLQDRVSVLSDLKLAEHLNAEIICVDDFDRLTTSSEVPIAVEQFRLTTKYKFVDIGKREVYFIK